KVMLGMIEQFCADNAGNTAVTEFIAPLRARTEEWQRLTMQIGKRVASDPDEVGAAAYDYLMYSGYVALAHWWARSVAASEASTQPEGFKIGKRETARFYFARILPRTLTHAAAMDSGSASLMELDAAQFDA